MARWFGIQGLCVCVQSAFRDEVLTCSEAVSRITGMPSYSCPYRCLEDQVQGAHGPNGSHAPWRFSQHVGALVRSMRLGCGLGSRLRHSNKREEIKEAQAGDIIAIVGLKDTTTGDTLCAVDSPIVLEKMEFPEPVIKVSCEPDSQKDADKMGEALAKLAAEDPSFRFSRDEESNQTVIEGMGELHLEIIIDRLKREFKVEANIGKPQVAYRETITEPVELWYTHKKQTGGSGQYAKLCMSFEPNPGEGFEFSNEIIGGTVPKEYVPAVVKGTEGELLNGIRMGFPVVDVKARLKDGGFHPVDSSAIAFEIAARACFKEGAGQAKPIVMEPIMKVEVITPEEYMGNIIGDLNSRRGIIQNLATRGNLHVVNASVPLAEMFSYIAELRNLSKGRANYAMEFEKYEPVPENVAESIEGKS